MDNYEKLKSAAEWVSLFPPPSCIELRENGIHIELFGLEDEESGDRQFIGNVVSWQDFEQSEFDILYNTIAEMSHKLSSPDI